ncbi:MAG TPA: glycoside hydrolase family 36 protein [Anaerolineales bacterium]|nr:glycoside hydrolase family 36 protein [Anaerolineales bacterium]
MTIELENRHLRFRLEASGMWTARPADGGSSLHVLGRCGASWWDGTRSVDWPGSFPDSASTTSPRLETPVGASQGVAVGFVAPETQVRVRIEWALPDESPFLFFRLWLRSGDEPVRLRAIDLLNAERGDASLLSHHSQTGVGGLQDPAAFITGWQSFGFAGALGPSDRYPRTRLARFVGPGREQPGIRAPRSRGRFLSEMFTVIGDRQTRAGVLLGAVTARQAFSSLDIDLRADPTAVRLWCHGDDTVIPAGGLFQTDWACLQFVSIDDAEPLAAFVDLAGRAGNARVVGRDSGITGWCSWYRLYRHIDEAGIRTNLAWLRDHRDHVPLDLVLVDDGYERKVGDWYPPWPRFPEGPEGLAERIRRDGFTPGLWIAPFVAERASKLVADHPEWILQRGDGRPVEAGLVGGNTPYALDATHPGVLDHVASLAREAVKAWGFGALKLDFLYAAALQGRRAEPRLTRAQAFRAALMRVRAAVGDDGWLIGCGCPFGPAIGIVDSMRISPDVAPHWHPHHRGVHVIMHAEATVPAVRNSLRNAVNLAPLDRRWWVNDPDCVLLQPEPSGWGEAAPVPGDASFRPFDAWRLPRAVTQRLGLAAHEVRTLLTVDALAGGSIIDSDHMPEVEHLRIDWLARMLPPLTGRPTVLDWFDTAYPSFIIVPLKGAAGDWRLVCMINWADRPRRLRLPLGHPALPRADGGYHGVDFWNERALVLEGDVLESPVLAPHGVFLACLRRELRVPTWLGDTLHVSMGLAVRGMRVGRNALEADLSLPRRAEGKVWLVLPGAPSAATLNGGDLPIDQEGDRVCVLPVAFDHDARLEVSWAAADRGSGAGLSSRHSRRDD